MSDDVNLIEFSSLRQCNVVMTSDADSDEEKEKYSGAHRHNFFELIWCLDDVGKQIIDFEAFDNKQGRIFSLTPGQVHEATANTQSMRMLIFSTDFVDNRYRKQALLDTFFSSPSSRPPYFDTPPEAVFYLDNIFMLMHEESQRQDPNWDLLESLAISFLYYIIRYASVDESLSHHHDTRVSTLKQLIDTHYQKEKSCDFYSNQLSITSKRLNELTKQALGKTVSTLIHERIVLEAKRELMFTEKSVKEIAFALGYADPSYFSRFYASHTGFSPSSFRQQGANNT